MNPRCQFRYAGSDIYKARSSHRDHQQPVLILQLPGYSLHLPFGQSSLLIPTDFYSEMPSISKIVLFFSISALVNAAIIPREESLSNVYKILQADPNIAEVPDLSIKLVKSTTTGVRGSVADITNLTVDVIPESEERFTVASVTTDTTDKLLFTDTLSTFLVAKTARDPGNLDWTDDGCSYSPDEPFGYNFLDSCKRHDFGYRNYKAQGRFTDSNRLRIDNNFKSDLYNECAKYSGISSGLCKGTADTYYAAVREFGGL